MEKTERERNAERNRMRRRKRERECVCVREREWFSMREFRRSKGYLVFVVFFWGGGIHMYVCTYAMHYRWMGGWIGGAQD